MFELGQRLCQLRIWLGGDIGADTTSGAPDTSVSQQERAALGLSGMLGGWAYLVLFLVSHRPLVSSVCGHICHPHLREFLKLMRQDAGHHAAVALSAWPWEEVY